LLFIVVLTEIYVINDAQSRERQTKELNCCLYIFFMQPSVNLIQMGKFDTNG